jgi:di/tricarboxylate transporter
MTRSSRLLWTSSATAAAALAVPAGASAATSSPPAGGAAIGQVVGASLAATVLTVALLVLGFGHRSGRVKVLKWGSDCS